MSEIIDIAGLDRGRTHGFLGLWGSTRAERLVAALLTLPGLLMIGIVAVRRL